MTELDNTRMSYEVIGREICGERLEFHPLRGLFWPARQILFVADLHLGKSGAFRAFGMPLPETAGQDIDRLQRMIEDTKAKRLIVLGDLIHSLSAIDSQLVQLVTDWRSQNSRLEITLVVGNHDKAVEPLANSWNIECVSRMSEEPFVYQHFPPDKSSKVDSQGITLCGHLHPKFQLQDKGNFRMKCHGYWIRKDAIVLPAFSSFVDGQVVKPSQHDEVILVQDDVLYPMS